MKQLNEQIKNNQFGTCYLFYGEERYLMSFYLDKMVEKMIGDRKQSMNYDVFEEGSGVFDAVMDGIETLPFFSDKRIVVLKNIGIMKAKNKTKAEKLVEAIENKPDSTVIFILEDEVDKRTKLFKTFQKIGQIIEFEHLSEADLIKYLARELNKYQKKIDSTSAKYFIETVGYELELIQNEILKLVNYVGDEAVVTNQDIDEICTKSIENKIFEMVACMGTNRRGHALQYLHDLISLKEPETRILYMITRQFRLLFQTKLLAEQGLNQSQIAAKLKVPPFVAGKNMAQAKSFTGSTLKIALNKCLEIETLFKTGKLDLAVGIEMVIIENSKV